MLNKPCNPADDIVQGQGVLNGFGIVHGGLQVTCHAFPSTTESFSIGIRFDSPPFTINFDTQNREFHNAFAEPSILAIANLAVVSSCR
jgi:hypothetical protein